MIKHIWSVICQNSVIDSSTNNISLLNVLEQLEISIPPTTPVPFNLPLKIEIVSLWAREIAGNEETFKVVTTYQDSSGNKIGEFINDFKFSKEHMRIRTRLQINGLGFNTAGDYQFKVGISSSKGVKTVATIPLQVSIKRDNIVASKT